MSDPYGPDLARVHDSGFTRIAHAAAQTLLACLAQRRLATGLVVDLGCGSGALAEPVAAVGYDVLGLDIAPAMIELARARVPNGRFELASVLDAELPPCVAVAAVGEVLSYLFDATHSPDRLDGLFARIRRALVPGGVFLFDVVTPGRESGPGPSRRFVETDDWTVLVTAEEDRARQLLTRRITTFFRQPDDSYRRTVETHHQRLVSPSELAATLRRHGFRVRSLPSYGEHRFPRGAAAFLATRPR